MDVIDLKRNVARQDRTDSSEPEMMFYDHAPETLPGVYAAGHRRNNIVASRPHLTHEV